MAALRGSVQIIEDGVVGVVLMEDCDKAFIKAVNQRITNTLGELGFASKWALVVGKNRGANNVAIAIIIRLPDMLNCSLGLVGVVEVELVENGRTHLMPCELNIFPINICCNFLRVGIHSLEVKIGGLEQHGTILEDGVQDVGLDVI